MLLPYPLVPHPSTGNALLVLEEGRRALYTSATVGLATAVLGALLMSLAGFYVVSNAIDRDTRSGCGSVLAATGVRNIEYLGGKATANAVYLLLLGMSFAAGSFMMLALRREGDVVLWSFLRPHVLLVPAGIMFASVAAVSFEAAPKLAGRRGDALYFLVWLALISASAALSLLSGTETAARHMDIAGVAFLLQRVLSVLEVSGLSIGGSFDPQQPLFALAPVSFADGWLFARTVSTLAPLLLLIPASRSFHRFDPVRLGTRRRTGRSGMLEQLDALFKPIARLLPTPIGRASLIGAAVSDTALTFRLHPSLVALALVLGAASLLTTPTVFQSFVLPTGIACTGIATADLACRELRAGTLELVYSCPRLMTRFVQWKLLAGLGVLSFVLGIPIVRLAVMHPGGLAHLAVGLFAVAASATSAGVLTRTPKTFSVAFLVFSYAAANDGGRVAMLDYAGLHGRATTTVLLAYGGLGVAGLLIAAFVQAWRVSKR